MSTFRILHLSDSHISDKNKTEISLITKCIIDDLNKLQSSDGNFSIEAICFSGDLIASGQNGGEFFEIAKDEFILPLLEAAKLSPDYFYTCMGNHENDLASFDDIIYQGLNSKFNSPDDLSKLWKANKIYNYLPVGVSSFKNFVEKTNTKAVSLSELTYVAKETFRDSNVGICAFNSAWNSCGETQKDYGRLVIGKEEIQKALVEIDGCNIKIAILHHPIEYLMEYDRIESEKLLQQFDLVLTGHTHSQNEFQRYSSVTNTLFLSAGRLDSYKTELTGYSIIEINPYNKEVKTFFRKYYDKRKCFDKAVDMSENGEFEYHLHMENKDLKDAYNLTCQLKDTYINFLNDKLVSNLFAHTEGQKIIKPIVKNYSEFLSSTQSNSEHSKETLLLEDLLYDDKNYIIMGRKEYGKSTALKYFATEFCNHFEKYQRFPIFVDMQKVDFSGKNQLFRAVTQFTHKSINADMSLDKNMLSSVLKSKYCVLIIDNIDMRNNNHIQSINSFLQTYPLLKCFVAIEEKTNECFGLQPFLLDLEAFEKIYLHSTSKNALFSFATSCSDTNGAAVVVDKISKTMSDLGMSKTPFNAIILMEIFQNDMDFSTISEANVVERFMEMILEKVNFSENYTSTFDFKNKEDFLTLLANKMYKNDRYYLFISEFEELLKDFFEPFGLDFKASGFETIFFSKKVLNNSDDSISFSYQFILEYYIAKSFIKFGIPNDLENDYKFLDFSNELNYYSGMTRQKNSLFTLIERLLIEQLDNYKVMIPDYKNYKIDINISYIYPKSKLSLEEKNTITDTSDNSNSYSPENYTKQSKHAPSPESLFPQLFYLYGRLVRNIDYLELQEKVNAVTYSMDACCLLLALFDKGLECVLKEKGDEIKASFLKHDASVNADSLLKEIVNAIKLSIPIALECSLYDCIGNTKLSPIFREVSQSNKFTDLEQCFFLMLYLDLHDGKSYEVVKKFIKTGTEKNLLNILYSKLIYSYMLTSSVYEESRLEDLIWVIVKKQNPTQLIRGQIVSIDKEKSFKALTDKKESLKASSETL